MAGGFTTSSNKNIDTKALPPPTNTKAIILAAFIAFGGFLFGYDIGVISGCLIMPDFVRRFGTPNGQGGFVLSSSRQSIITSLLSAGTFVYV